LVRVAAGLLAMLILCGCWADEPRPLPAPTTRPPPERTTGRLPGLEVVGLCMTQSRAGEKEFIPCDEAPRPGFRLRGRVIDAVPEPPDAFVGTSTTVRSPCPSGTDVVRALLPSGNVGVLCVDTVPAYGNTRS
jgi:hypothetical protein